MSVRVLVVDDQEPFRLAAAAVVTATAGFELVGSAITGEASLAAVDELHPDLVLMDIQLPGIDGLQSTRQVRARQPAVRVLLVSSNEEYDEAADCGALVYLPKSTLSPALLQEVWAGHQIPVPLVPLLNPPTFQRTVRSDHHDHPRPSSPGWPLGPGRTFPNRRAN